MWQAAEWLGALVVSLTCTLCSLCSNESLKFSRYVEDHCQKATNNQVQESRRFCLDADQKRLHATQQKTISHSKAYSQNPSLQLDLFSAQILYHRSIHQK